MWRVRAVSMVAGCALLAAGCSATASSTPGRSAATGPPTHTPAPVTTPSTTPSVAARTTPNPCRANTHGQLVKVSLAAQHLWMCHGTRVVHQSAVTSGMTGKFTRTPKGHYRIQGRNRNTVLTLNDGQQYDVKYWIPFDAPLFGFHDAPWQKFPFGSAKYHQHGSHGCVHLPEDAIATLYHWAHIGTRVDIEQ